MSLRDTLSRITDPHRTDLRPSKPGAGLDIGCGRAKWAGAIGLDHSTETDADVVHDLNVFPYPFDDDSFDQIRCQDVIEHVDHPLRLFEEIHRIGRPGARVHLRTPHFSSVLAYSDPTHQRALSAMGVRSLAEPRFAHYTAARFTVVSIHIDMWAPYRLLGIEHLANRFEQAYEKYLAFTFTAMNVRAEFEVDKWRRRGAQ